MSTGALQCLSTTVCASLPEPIHPCALLPPTDPDQLKFPDIFNSIQNFKLTKPTWSDYTERCLGGTTAFPTTVHTAVTTETVTTAEGETTSVFHTVTQTLTEAVTNVTIDLKPDTITADTVTQTTPIDGGSKSFNWIIPVAIIAVLLIFIAVIFIICKIYHNSKSSGDTNHPVDLQLHENVNYLNNKAEAGAYWRGHNPENVEENGNSVDRKRTSMTVSTETGTANGCNGDLLFTDSNKKTKLLSAEYNQSEEERRLSLVNSETPATARELVSDSPNLQSRRKPFPSPKPKKSVKKKHSRKSKSKKEDETAIYANHQFEKLAKSHDNVVFEREHDHSKPLPPEPLPFPPLSRPLPPQPSEESRPTPARRSKSKVTPSVNDI
ncbi:uncharacterized protein LOC117323675 isoform X8 [Pecten maximus]|uniref:uncharacterized protein LOC117323675 isoform X8 n=1 Tax=Pecten maximus TaxID=6579 RepID=UPI0014590E0D|nr:uncharacterized protein LOC117323675 isoform X8 [Pecten maximus]